MAQTDKKIFVVIPAYQAESTLPSVFQRIPKDCQTVLTKILVVVDGCTDGTEKVGREAVKDYSLPVEFIVKPKNEGYARAQKTGFREALKQGADIAVLLHADGQYAPEEMLRLLTPLMRDEADVRMLGGGALQGGMPLYKFVANKSLSMLENVAYGMKLAEYHSGYMLYNRRTLESVPFEKLSDTFHFDGEMLLVSHKRKLRIVQLPIPTRYAKDIKSHLKPIPYGFDVLKVIWRNATGKYDFK
jgi:glycosyltransferase involved in cell wall biosynthesis